MWNANTILVFFKERKELYPKYPEKHLTQTIRKSWATNIFTGPSRRGLNGQTTKQKITFIHRGQTDHVLRYTKTNKIYWIYREETELGKSREEIISLENIADWLKI